MPAECYEDVGVYEIAGFARERALHVGHESGVHARETLRPVHLHREACLLSLRRNAVREQEVTARRRSRMSGSMQLLQGEGDVCQGASMKLLQGEEDACQGA